MPSKLILQSIPAVPPAPPFDPNAVPGIFGWWRADAGVTESGGRVSAMLDQSPNGRNLTQANALNQPALIDIGGGLKALLSTEAVSPQQLYLETAGGDTLASNKLSMAVCVTYPDTSGSGFETIAGLSNGANSGNLFGIVYTALNNAYPNAVVFGADWNGQPGDLRMVTPSGLTIGPDTGTPLVLAMRANRTALVGDISKNKTVLTTGLTGSTNINITGTFFLGKTLYQGCYRGQIREVIIYDDYLSDTDYLALQNYLMTKYGIA